MTFERKLAMYMIIFWVIMTLIIALHWWADAAGEDASWLWSCHTMGNRQCGPGQPWIEIQIGGAD